MIYPRFLLNHKFRRKEIFVHMNRAWFGRKFALTYNIFYYMNNDGENFSSVPRLKFNESDLPKTQQIPKKTDAIP